MQRTICHSVSIFDETLATLVTSSKEIVRKFSTKSIVSINFRSLGTGVRFGSKGKMKLNENDSNVNTQWDIYIEMKNFTYSFVKSISRDLSENRFSYEKNRSVCQKEIFEREKNTFACCFQNDVKPFEALKG